MGALPSGSRNRSKGSATVRRPPGWRTAVMLGLLILIPAACGDFGSVGSGSRNLIVVGDSLSSGHQSGCTVQGVQEHGYANLVAKQAGWPLTLPLISQPGVRPCMEILVQDNPATIQRVLPDDQANDPTYWGVRLNPTVQPTNLGTPGTLLSDVIMPRPTELDARYDPGGLDYPAVWRLFLDQPHRLPDHMILEIALGLIRASETDRDLVIFWLGSNELLWPALGGSSTPLLTMDDFQAILEGSLGLMVAFGAEVVVGNVPYLTDTAHFTTKTEAEFWTACVDIPINPDDLVNLKGLWALAVDCASLDSDAHVLTSTEVTEIRDTVDGYNAIIAATAEAYGAAYADVKGVLEAVVPAGYDIEGVTLTSRYCGGLFSLDGVHPSNTGYAIVANAFIQALNAQLGYAIPSVDVASVWASEAPRNLCIPES